MEAKYPLNNIGNESVQTKIVEMVGGKADFNQIITLPINMYYDQSSQLFQEKKVKLPLFRPYSHSLCRHQKEKNKQELFMLKSLRC